MRRTFLIFIQASAISFLLSCSTTIPQVEYVGSELNFSKEYSLSQMMSSMLFVKAPPNEDILVNIYKPDGTLLLTLFDGNSGESGTNVLSLAILFEKYKVKLSEGKHEIHLLGKQGKAQFNLMVN